MPTITHYSLKPGVGSIVLASDGVLEKLSDTEICTHVEEAKLDCPPRIQSQDLEPPIPLSGETAANGDTLSCEPLRLGLSPILKYRLLGNAD